MAIIIPGFYGGLSFPYGQLRTKLKSCNKQTMSISNPIRSNLTRFTPNFKNLLIANQLCAQSTMSIKPNDGQFGK